MAAVPNPGEIFRSTDGKANFQRVARLLISGGGTLLRGVFDMIHPPSDLPRVLNDPTTKNQLKSARLTKPQRDCLYPSPGVYGKSTDFDITLLFSLLRTICNLTPPATGWDALPVSTEHSLAADLARIKYYRNSVYGHVKQNMEIADDAFSSLWHEISGALVRIAGQINPAKKDEWQEATDNFLKDPLTAEDERNVQELLEWCRHDMEVKKSIEELTKGIARLETGLATKEDIDDIKAMLCKITNLLLQMLPSTDQEVEVPLRIDCEAIPRTGPSGGSSKIAITAQGPQTENQLQAESTEGVDPTAQEVLHLIAQKYLETIVPSTTEDINEFVRYLQQVRRLLIDESSSVLSSNPGTASDPHPSVLNQKKVT